MLMNRIRTLATLAGVGFAAAAPVAAQSQNMPSYATHEDTIKGTIVSIDSQFGISVRDERGFIDRVMLHQGTVINPTGLSLAPGMSVTILGRTQGSTFAANEIDTPYQVTGSAPSAYDYAPYDAGQYGYVGSPYGYGGGYPYYGSSIAIGVGGYYPSSGYYPSYGYYPNYVYPANGYYSHGYGGSTPHNNGGHGVPVPYHTYPYHNPAPPAAMPHMAAPPASMPHMAVPPASMPHASVPQAAAGYHGFGAVRESGGGYRGFGAAPARH